MCNKFLKLSKKKILLYQKNRPPYLMVDYINKLVPGKLSEGYKILKKNEWFFKVHWKGDPNMPGMLQIESLVQTAALSILSLPRNKGKIMYLANADNIKFYKKITPESKLIIKTKVLSWKRGVATFIGEGFLLDKKACSANFTLILPEKIIKVK